MRTYLELQNNRSSFNRKASLFRGKSSFFLHFQQNNRKQYFAFLLQFAYNHFFAPTPPVFIIKSTRFNRKSGFLNMKSGFFNTKSGFFHIKLTCPSFQTHRSAAACHRLAHQTEFHRRACVKTDQISGKAVEKQPENSQKSLEIAPAEVRAQLHLVLDGEL